jgi:hypothetical protein
MQRASGPCALGFARRSARRLAPLPPAARASLPAVRKHDRCPGTASTPDAWTGLWRGNARVASTSGDTVTQEATSDARSSSPRALTGEANLGQEIAGRGILPRRVRPVATQESPCRDPEALNRSQSWGVTGGDKWGKSGADDTVSDGSLWV